MLSCLAQVIKGQQLVRESFWKPLPVLLPLLFCALLPAFLLATEMLPLPCREEGHSAWPRSCPSCPFPPTLAAECLPSACLIREGFTGRPSQAALLFLESRPLTKRGGFMHPGCCGL